MKYMVQIIDQKGRKPDPERAKAIKNMPSLDNVTKLQAFLHLTSYGIYILKMYELVAPLNEILKKGKKKKNSARVRKDISRNFLKCQLSDLSLAHFNPKKELIVASDASDSGNRSRSIA